jgi:hypothetical protein
MRDGRMHQTTIRVSPDLWEALEAECLRLGVSAAQYFREAALARLLYTASRRGDEGYERAFAQAGATVTGDGSRTTRERATIEVLEQGSREQLAAAPAVSGQSDLAWRRARALRAEAQQLRLQRREKRQ